MLASCIRELKVNKEKFITPGPKDDIEVVMEEYELNIITALYLCTIITKLLKSSSDEEDQDLSYKLIYQLNHMHLKLRDGQTLLHLAVNGVTPVDDFHTSDVCRFPCVETVKLLLECGASISALDCSRNSPLHTLTATVRGLWRLCCRMTHLKECLLSIFSFKQPDCWTHRWISILWRK